MYTMYTMYVHCNDFEEWSDKKTQKTPEALVQLEYLLWNVISANPWKMTKVQKCASCTANMTSHSVWEANPLQRESVQWCAQGNGGVCNGALVRRAGEGQKSVIEGRRDGREG